MLSCSCCDERLTPNPDGCSCTALDCLGCDRCSEHRPSETPELVDMAEELGDVPRIVE